MAIWRVWILNRLSSFCIAPKTLNPKPWFSFLLDLLPRKVFYYFRKRHTFWGMPLVSLANPMQSNIVWCVHIAQCRSIYFRHIFLKEKNCTWYKEISNCQLISCHCHDLCTFRRLNAWIWSKICPIDCMRRTVSGRKIAHEFHLLLQSDTKIIVDEPFYMINRLLLAV